MKEIQGKQAELLRILRENIYNPLTIRELGELVGIESPGVVHHHLTSLEKKGYLKRNPSNPKDYVIFDNPEKSVVYINMYGTAQCGPTGSILDGNPIEKIPIPRVFLKFPASEAFIVEAVGDSMEPKIKKGDILIARKQNTADDGEIVVCSYKSDVRIKTFHKLENCCTLTSINKKYPPIVVDDESAFYIDGVVKNIHNYE